MAYRSEEASLRNEALQMFEEIEQEVKLAMVHEDPECLNLKIFTESFPSNRQPRDRRPLSACRLGAESEKQTISAPARHIYTKRSTSLNSLKHSASARLGIAGKQQALLGGGCSSAHPSGEKKHYDSSISKIEEEEDIGGESTAFHRLSTVEGKRFTNKDAVVFRQGNIRDKRASYKCYSMFELPTMRFDLCRDEDYNQPRQRRPLPNEWEEGDSDADILDGSDSGRCSPDVSDGYDSEMVVMAPSSRPSSPCELGSCTVWSLPNNTDISFPLVNSTPTKRHSVGSLASNELSPSEHSDTQSVDSVDLVTYFNAGLKFTRF